MIDSDAQRIIKILKVTQPEQAFAEAKQDITAMHILQLVIDGHLESNRSYLCYFAKHAGDSIVGRLAKAAVSLISKDARALDFSAQTGNDISTTDLFDLGFRNETFASWLAVQNSPIALELIKTFKHGCGHSIEPMLETLISSEKDSDIVKQVAIAIQRQVLRHQPINTPPSNQ